MTTRVACPIEVKQEGIRMKLARKTTTDIMATLNIKNKTQTDSKSSIYEVALSGRRK